MIRLFIVLTMLLCSSCAKRPILPDTEIEFISVATGGDSLSWSVRFSSKTDVLNFFKDTTGETQLGETLFCSLDKELEFENSDKLTNYFVGNLVEVDADKSGLDHIYTSRLSAVRKEDEGVSNVFMSAEELLALLNERNAVSCRVFTSAYSFGGYYSKSMLIPATDLVHVIEQQRVQ
ncbi:hypothetical protein D3C87_1102160 [compost metagenome]